MPVPEPPPVTATTTFGLTLVYSSERSCIRFTIVSEPLAWMTTVGSPDGVPQARSPPMTSRGTIRWRRMESSSAVPAFDVATRSLVARGGEQDVGGRGLDELAHQHEGAAVGHTPGLLHV